MAKPAFKFSGVNMDRIKKFKLFLLLGALGLTAMQAGCRAEIEPHIIVPRVFDDYNRFQAVIKTYPGEKPGKLTPVAASLYEKWKRKPARAFVKNIGTEKKPAWRVIIYHYIANTMGVPDLQEPKDPAFKELHTYPHTDELKKLIPEYHPHLSQQVMLIAVKYQGEYFTVSVPLNKREVEIYSAPFPAVRWTAGSEKISKIWSW